jgi:hypothetical protein
MPMKGVFIALAWAGCIAATNAVTIDIDYTYDSGNFFTNNPEAKIALERAAADVGAAITRSLPAVTTSTFTGTSGSGTVQIQWGLQLTNPTTGMAVTLNSFSFAADHFTVYVGARAISAGAGEDVLGQTLPAAPQASFPQAEASTSADFFNAAALVAYDSNVALSRGGNGPVFFSTSTPLSFDSESHNVPFQTGLLAATIAFSNDTSQWHFDPDTAVEAGKFDFYTVAVHELLHALGFGAATVSWAENVSGTNWIGASAASMPSGGVGILDSSNDDHIAQNTMSTTVVGGVTQEVAMSGAELAGMRKLVTSLDRLFLYDIGYDPGVSPTPWPTPALTPTPTPTPTPAATPTATPIPTPPLPPSIKGKTKITTTLPKVTITGTVAPGASVVYKIGNGRQVKASGGTTWKIVVKLNPGKTVVTIASFDSVTGLSSVAKKVVIVKK